MENNHDIDKKFNEASQSLEEPVTFPGFDKVWAKVEEKLEKKDDKKRILPIWFPYGIAASLIIGLGAFYFIDRNNASEIQKPAIVQNTVSPKVNSNVQGIDSLVKSNIEKHISIRKPEVLVYESIVPVPNISPIYNNEISSQNLNAVKDNIAHIEPGHDGIMDRDDKPIAKAEFEDVSMSNTVSASRIEVSEGVIVAQKTKKYNDSVFVMRDGFFTTDSYNIRKKDGDYKIMSSKIKLKKGNSNSSTIVGPAQIYIAGNDNAALLSLQGKISGVTITNSNSNIIGNQKIQIRGMRSLSGNNNAVVVIDNVISPVAALSQLPHNKIKSMQILKGSQATALYGSEAGNGVVLVYTNRSRKERKYFQKKLQKVQDSINRSRQIQQQNSEEYDAFVENPFELTKNQSVSTFSIDVDKAAYSNIRRMINNGEYVNKNAVRIEEMINYFKYDYPQPKNNQPFSINTEYNDSPWNNNHKLLKIGLQGKEIPMDKLPNSNFVFLIDVSGSMNAANKLPLLKSSFKALLDQLRPTDKVGIVVYAGSAGMVLPPTSAKEKEKIIEALDKLEAGGSTAGGAGIELAYKLAQENFIKGGNNRVIIATDGDFNVGASSTGDLQTLVEEKRKSGVFLTCLGFGMGNFKDNHMETLANKGNGNYAYIDNLQEANKFLGKEFAGNMYAIAKDVKIQIEFNPKYVKSYRLIGYENRKLKNEDFTNDKIDAGELGSGHTVTALYEVIPADVKSEFLPKETDLKYTKNTNDENFGDELATVKFRYKKPDGNKSSEIVQVVKNSETSFSSASPDFKFASSVAWFGLILRNSDLIKNKDLKEVEKLAKKGRGNDEDGYRSEFVRLVETFKSTQE